MTRFLPGIAAALLALWATTAFGNFHTFRIEQIYSNADGSVQFVVMREAQGADGEHVWSGHSLGVSSATTSTHYPFPTNLPSERTAERRVLIASEGFAALGLIAPDYVFPNGFLIAGEGIVNFAEVDQVAYTALPRDGRMALTRDGTLIPNLATNFAGQTASVTPPPPPPPPPAADATSYQGLWWNAPAGSESGWGINFAHQGDTIFASWFTFDTDGSPLWMVVAANKTASKVYSGNLVRGTGPAYNAVPFNPALVVGATVGTATFTFADATHATFAFAIGATSLTKSLVRQEFASPVPGCTWSAATPLTAATNFQDLWWAAPASSESGWGINLTHQGDTIFGTWFTFDLAGKPLWMVVSAARTAANTYAGKLLKGTGPAYNAPFDAGKVTPAEVGTATFTFSDGANGTFVSTIDGQTLTKQITREIFAAPGTLCQ
jgi:hypothetical protein